jgi:membrane-associated phospholipid phosphatase
MGFFNYHLPPFLTVMGVLYILVAAPILINLLRHGYWQGVFGEICRIIRTKWRWITGVIIVVLAMITWVDLPVTLFVKYLEPITHSYTFWDFICSCAEGGTVVGFIFTLMMLANYYGKHKLAEVSKISLMSSIYGGLANGVLKFLFNRQRPAIGLDQWNFFAFFKSGGEHLDNLMYAYNSMPSGHTISTVAAIVPFFICYKNKTVRSLLVWWACMVAFARVYTINHWLSDVTIATMFGLIIGVAVYRVNQQRVPHLRVYK